MTQNPNHSTPQASRRKMLRSPLIVLKVKLDDGRNPLFGYAKNISRGGLFIATVNPGEPGSRFTVEFALPEPVASTVRCTCEVVWKRRFSRKSPYEPGMGLRFLDLAEETAEAIERWVGSRDA